MYFTFYVLNFMLPAYTPNFAEDVSTTKNIRHAWPRLCVPATLPSVI